jgi:hypothetical protein
MSRIKSSWGCTTGCSRRVLAVMHCCTILATLQTPQAWSAVRTTTRREVLLQNSVAPLLIATGAADSKIEHPFLYSPEWTGTALPLLSLEQAVAQGQTNQQRWPMGRWPDPILRRKADPVGVQSFDTKALQQACEYLRNTATEEKAVGLTA